MNLPRLIIADEITAGTVAPGLILVYAMKRAGFNVRVFTCARAESDVRFLKFLLDEPVVSLDCYTQGNIKNLKTLFQKAAAPDAVNVVLVPLGTRTDEEFIQVRPEALELAKALSCGIVPVFKAAASAILTSNIVTAALTTIQEENENHVLGVIFAAVKNPREYQMLEQDYGRRSPILSLGYLPKEIERVMPPMQDLYSSTINTRLMQVKSAALQLLSNSHQIEWNILQAFGVMKQEWTAPQETLILSKRFKVAVVGEKSLSLEGSHCLELFRFLGCEAVDYDPWQDPFPMDAEVVYFPHSMGSLYAERLLAHAPFVGGIKQAFTANKLILANGGSAPLFGKFYVSSDGQKHEALDIFPFHGAYSSLKTSSDVHRIEIRSTTDTFFSKNDEKMRGYALDYVHVGNPGNVVPPVWAYRDVRKGTELGNSGWARGYCLVTDLHLELWSNIDVVNRWLSLRKR